MQRRRLLLDRRAGVAVASLRSLVQSSMSLAVETAVVAVGTIAAVRLLHVHRLAGLHWLLIPCLLVAAALAPTWIAGRKLSQHRSPRRAAPPGSQDRARGLPVHPAAGLSRAVAADLLSGVPIPLRPVLAGQQTWLTWLLYQFLYVAAAEEVFFRGYIQANAMRLLRERPRSRAGAAVDRHRDLRRLLRPGPRRRPGSDSIGPDIPARPAHGLAVRANTLPAGAHPVSRSGQRLLWDHGRDLGMTHRTEVLIGAS